MQLPRMTSNATQSEKVVFSSIDHVNLTYLGLHCDVHTVGFDCRLHSGIFKNCVSSMDYVIQPSRRYRRVLGSALLQWKYKTKWRYHVK